MIMIMIMIINPMIMFMIIDNDDDDFLRSVGIHICVFEGIEHPRLHW